MFRPMLLRRPLLLKALLTLRRARFVPAVCLALFGLSLSAQSGTYAGSAEYQGMLEELHAPAPSPIFLATGVRPLPEQGLKVQVHNTRNSLELKTRSMQITIDRPTATVTMLNLQTRPPGCSPSPDQMAAAPTVPTVPPAFANITRQQNTWTISLRAPEVDTPIILELLHAGMAASLHRAPHARPGPCPLYPSTSPEPTPASASESAFSRQPFPTPTSMSVPPIAPASRATTGAT